MKFIKWIDMKLVNLVAITFFSFFQVLQNFHNANRTFAVMAFVSFAIFYLLTLIYLYAVYVAEPGIAVYNKWSKEKWVRIGAVVAGAYFILLVLFPVLSKNEWVYYGLSGFLFVFIVSYIIVARIKKGQVPGKRADL